MVWKHSKTYLFIYNFNILKEESFNYKIFQLSNSKKLYWCQQGIGILKKPFWKIRGDDSLQINILIV